MTFKPMMLLAAAAAGLALMADVQVQATVYEGCAVVTGGTASDDKACCTNVHGTGDFAQFPASEATHVYDFITFQTSQSTVNDAAKATDCGYDAVTGCDADNCMIHRSCGNYDGFGNAYTCQDPDMYYDEAKNDATHFKDALGATRTTQLPQLDDDECCARKTCGSINQAGQNFDCSASPGSFMNDVFNPASAGETMLSFANCCKKRTCGDWTGDGSTLEANGVLTTSIPCTDTPVPNAGSGSNGGEQFPGLANTANTDTSGTRYAALTKFYTIPTAMLTVTIESLSAASSTAAAQQCCHARTCANIDGNGTPYKCDNVIFVRDRTKDDYAVQWGSTGTSFVDGNDAECCKPASCSDIDGAGTPFTAFSEGYVQDSTKINDCTTGGAACTGTAAAIVEATCRHAATCGNVDGANNKFSCPGGRIYGGNDGSGIGVTPNPSASPPLLGAAVSDIVCCVDPTCTDIDGVGGDFSCPTGTTQIATAFATATAATDPSANTCCFTRTCGNSNGLGKDYDCNFEDGDSTTTKFGYKFKTGSDAVVLGTGTTDDAANFAQCCEAMTCGNAAAVAGGVAGAGAALSCTGPTTLPPAYTGTATTLSPAPTTAPTDGSVSLTGYVFATSSSASALTSVLSTASDLQDAYNKGCCVPATCGDIDGAGTDYNCALKASASDTDPSDQYFVFESSTQPNGLTSGINSIDVEQATCCRNKVCADSDGQGTAFACSAGLMLNTANSGTAANLANGVLDDALCCIADPNYVATTTAGAAASTAGTTAAGTTAAGTTAAGTTAGGFSGVAATDVFTDGCASFTAAQQEQAMRDLATELGLDLSTIDFSQSTFVCATARRSRRNTAQTATITFAVQPAAAAAAQTLVNAAAFTTTAATSGKGKKSKGNKAAKMPKAKGNKTAKAAKMPKAKGNKTAKAAKVPKAKGNKTAKAAKMPKAKGNKTAKAAKAKAAKQMLQDQVDGGATTAASGTQTGLALLGGLLGVVGVAVGLRKRGAGGAGYAVVGDASVLEATEKSPLMATPTAYQRAPDGVEP